MDIYSPRNPLYGFYIYAYINSSTGTPYYIGKGKLNRAWDNNHSVNLPTDRKYIVILESGLTEIGAWALERRYIRIWGRKNNSTGILLNVMPGGPSPEQTPEMVAKQLKTKMEKGFKSMSSPETINKWKASRKKNNKKRTIEMDELGRKTKLEKYGTLSIRYDDSNDKMLETKKLKGNFRNSYSPEANAKRLKTREKNSNLHSGNTPEAKSKRLSTMLAKWGTTDTREIGRLKNALKNK